MRLRYLAALLVVSSCRCARLDDGLIYRCGPNGECEPGHVCELGLCVTGFDGGEDAGADAGCTPTRRCEPGTCGVLADDGCGNTLDCADCELPLRCGAVEPNRCGCVKLDAGSLTCPLPVAGQRACGTKTLDNCGTLETFACGDPTCPNGGVCVENICCDPVPDLELCSATTGFVCGRAEVIDRCGTHRVFGCPSCGAGEQCVYGDFGSTCVTAMACEPENDFELCNRLGANCGALSALDRCGAMRTGVVCGGDCDAGSCTSTLPNQCTCQPLLAGCAVQAHCCAGLECGAAGLCCVGIGAACDDDSQCCGGQAFCQQLRCCYGPGVACSKADACCSGVCGADGGCEAVDAGHTWDGGEL